MKKKVRSECASCTVSPEKKACMIPGGSGARGCPTLTEKTNRQKALDEYRKEDVAEFARQATIQEGECYAGREKKPYVMHAVKPRMQEICEFAQKMGYSRLGLAFCGGLTKEGAVVNEILKNHGFEVISVMCKAGGVPKEEIGVRDDQKIYIGEFEPMCNPILQATLLNEAETQFNVVLGLCVGHDSLFFKYAKAPSTVLAVKDRAMGHNPLACIYTTANYAAWVRKP